MSDENKGTLGGVSKGGEVTEQNIVKKVCRELGITQRELALKIGMSPDSLNVAVSNNKISQIVKNSINLIVENERLKDELKKYENLKNALKSAIS